mgnify:CR=1 FL=1
MALAGRLPTGPTREPRSASGSSRHVRGRLQEQGYQLEVTEDAKAYLAEVGYEPVYGARPLKRAIQRELQDPLAMEMLAGKITPGDIIHVERGQDGLTFESIPSGPGPNVLGGSPEKVWNSARHRDPSLQNFPLHNSPLVLKGSRKG